MDVDSTRDKNVERGLSANSIYTDTNDEDYEDFDGVEAITDPTIDEEKNCRICWSSGGSKENPLLLYCLCAGYVGFIHFKCLQEWLNTRRQQKTSPNFCTYFWKAFECEICKKAYPLVMKA